ncbi:MAG: hypothetical protein RBS89_00600 [Candidatus Delongbacteria bacterium]|jgi:MOSC domain-containing protein YiiM|nr:hypothetical protein [Candidatus Delongbacteria bacterium]
MNGKIFAINISSEKKTPKKQISSGNLIKDTGLKGDAYNKIPNRQISITTIELLKEQALCPRVSKNSDFTVKTGDYCETLTISGIDLSQVETGDTFLIGEKARICISGKSMDCWVFCPWNKLEGECPLPKHFLFARVIESGEIKVQNEIKQLEGTQLSLSAY